MGKDISSGFKSQAFCTLEFFNKMIKTAVLTVPNMLKQLPGFKMNPRRPILWYHLSFIDNRKRQ